jgi:hypothetical protein
VATISSSSACQHDQRHPGRGGAHPAHRLQPLRIGQSEVQKGEVYGALGKMRFGFTHGLGMDQDGFARAVLIEHFTDQTGVTGIVLDHE